jgi:hypothetical protein
MEVDEYAEEQGGDEETTHMVKGLDFALLAKMKMKLLKEERETEDKKKEAQATQAAENKNQVCHPSPLPVSRLGTDSRWRAA